jgi:hypothetical protein
MRHAQRTNHVLTAQIITSIPLPPLYVPEPTVFHIHHCMSQIVGSTSTSTSEHIVVVVPP